MKNLFFLPLILIFTTSAFSSAVTLTWDASLSPHVDGYEIYSKDFERPYDYDDPMCVTEELGCTVTVLDDRQTAFVARAFKFGPYDLNGNRIVVYSGISNQAVHVPFSPEPPTPPRSLATKILQALLDFFGQFLNSSSKDV